MMQKPLLDSIEDMSRPRSQYSFFQLYRYAKPFDYLLLALGSLAAISSGISLPFFSLVFGDMMNNLVNPSENHFTEQLASTYKLLILAGFAFSTNFVYIYCFNLVGERQVAELRTNYYSAILKQKVGWFDSFNASQLNPSALIQDIQNALGQKMGVSLNMLAMFLLGIGLGFYKGWQLALALICLFPFVAIGGALVGWAFKTFNAVQNQYKSKIGGKIELSLSTLRTIKSLCGQQFQFSNLYKKLEQAKKQSIFKLSLASIALGAMILSFFSVYGVAFWYGSKLVMDKDLDPSYDIGKVLAVFFCVVMGGSGIGQAGTQLQTIGKAKASGQKLLELIDSDQQVNGKVILTEIESIQFLNVCFRYPTKPQILVLKNLSFEIISGKKVAFVGQTGCGKSTIVQLMLRFYRPTAGKILVNGIDLNEIQIQSFRRLVGYVGQQPALFATTIMQNLSYSKPKATDIQIQRSLKLSNSFQFISKLQNGLQTYLGNSGGNISGGQKQRIALARAILRNPKLLILDEATSALDKQNQQVVQESIENLSKQLMQIIIAHRLITIQKVDEIIMLQNGELVEKGTHQKLMQNRSAYFQIFKHQTITSKIKFTHNSNTIQQNSIPVSTLPNQQINREHQDKVFRRVMELGSQFKFSFIGVILFSAGAGAVFPLFSFLFSNVIALFQNIQENKDQITLYCIGFLILAGLAGLINGLQSYFSNIFAQSVALKIRSALIKKLINLPVSYYDKQQHSIGNVSKIIFQDVSSVRNYFSGTVGVLVMNFFTFLLGFGLAFYSQWLMALTLLALTPLMILSGILNINRMKKLTELSGAAFKDSNSQISFTLDNIRTIYSLGNKETLVQKYREKLIQPFNIQKKKSFSSAMSTGLSQASIFGVYAGALLIAALILDKKKPDLQDLFRSIFCLIFSAVGLGSNSKLMPDQAKAKVGGRLIFDVLDQKDQLQLDKGVKQIQKFDIQFKNVSFKYPQRQKFIIQNISFKISPGQKLGLIGQSGCGKSTICQLLLRFYQPCEGIIMVGGQSLQNYKLSNIRNNFGIVFQQPKLFDGSINQNIKYNIEIKDKDLQLNCIDAQAFQFIQKLGQNSFKQGLEVRTGARGQLVSGGQKQRLAIARFLGRKINFFLLDQATSALDSDTERKVLQKLQKRLVDLPGIVIAHRQSSLKICSKILKIQEGKII